MLLSFVVSVVMINFYNEATYGGYILAFSIIELFSVFSLLGTKQYFLMNIPKSIDNTSKITSIYSYGRNRTLIAAIFIGLLLFGASFLPIQLFQSDTTKLFFRIGSVLLPLLAFGELQSAFLNSLKASNRSQLSDKIIKPSVLILLIIVLVYLNYQAENLIIAYVISIVIGLIVNYIFIRKKVCFTKLYEKLNDSTLGKTLGLIVIINFITLLASKTDLYMLGWISGEEYSGLYNIYHKMSAFISIGLSSSLVIITPILSEKLANNDHSSARKETKSISRLSLLIGLVIFIGIYFFASYFFKVYKTPIFNTHIVALYIFCFGSIFNLLSGPSGSLLLAGKKLKQILIAQLFGIVLNIILNILLIPSFQIMGAALATLASQIIVNVLLYYFCIKHLKINPTAFGK